MADLSKLKMPPRKRQSFDEQDPETGAPLEDIPGVQHDEVSGALMDAPAAMMAGPAEAGMGIMSRMASRAAPEAAEEAGTTSAASALSRIKDKLMPAAKNAGQGLAKQTAKQVDSAVQNKAAAPTTREINDSLRTANPSVAKQAGSNLDTLGKQGPQAIRDIENRRVAQTEGNALSSIGARARTQRVKVRSNPTSGTLDYSNKFNPKFTPNEE